MMTKTGTVAFSAPEIFLQQYYDEKVDVWSAGTVLYMMLCGQQPFFHDNHARVVHKITTEEPNMEAGGCFKDVSPDALELLLKMLTKDPSKRPSAAECLNH